MMHDVVAPRSLRTSASGVVALASACGLVLTLATACAPTPSFAHRHALGDVVAAAVLAVGFALWVGTLALVHHVRTVGR